MTTRATHSWRRAGPASIARRLVAVTLVLAASACEDSPASPGPRALPPTKLALLQAVDEALRARDVRRLDALWATDALVAERCASASQEDRARLTSKLRERRQEAEAAFAECLALVDLSKAERLALNYGSRVQSGEATCPAWQTHESSELYYDVGGAVTKVSLRGALALGDRHALGGSLRCGKGKGSAAEMRRALLLFGQRCPDQPWPALTQVRGPCPRLTR